MNTNEHLLSAAELLGIACCMVVASTMASASPIQWSENGHWYEVVVDASVTWTSARESAASLSYQGYDGHLATITSSAENQFIADNLLAVTTGYDFCIGGFQAGGPEPAGGWSWVTGESFTFTNWASGEPSNDAGAAYGNMEEDYLVIWKWKTFGKWNDTIDAGSPFFTYKSGYIVEYDSVPEPGMLSLLSIGGVAIMRRRGNRRRHLSL